ncbi:MAG: Slp family lipoprotein, partial [Candidatus Competibacteraceae bacterium]|nr:Slp family lipoprotein [Candidatus Competibacteraceae bacterium]
MRNYWLVSLVLIVLLSAGCSTITTSAQTGTINRQGAGMAASPAQHSIPSDIGPTSLKDLSLFQVIRERDRVIGASVRWGGTIISLANEPGWTLVEVQAYALDQTGRPSLDTATEGRFLARARIPFDEVVYAPGRPLTLAGTLQGTVMAGSQVIPIIEANSLYFWDESPDAGDRYRYALRPNRSDEAYSYPDRFDRPWRY